MAVTTWIKNTELIAKGDVCVFTITGAQIPHLAARNPEAKTVYGWLSAGFINLNNKKLICYTFKLKFTTVSV